jgi:hypothetical protein
MKFLQKGKVEGDDCNTLTRAGDQWVIGIETETGCVTTIRFTSKILASKLRKSIWNARKEGFTFCN